MKITKDSIVSYVCGIDSKITLEDLSKHLGVDVEKFVSVSRWGLGAFGLEGKLGIDGMCELDEHDGKLSFNWKCQEDLGLTQFLKNVFNEEYVLRVDLKVEYEEIQESYVEILIFDNQKQIVENVVRYDGEELTLEEKSIHDNRDDDYFLESYDVTFIKKSEFNKDDVEGQPIVY